eukprot:TRINITY_DN7528_c0_g5_i1.p1 TRINITY_DN7528_c0_g5~~TRINITY_DN7528_c0_g5_i1.p1  ORF type:complete len:295 (-),score=33.09 TRINITY_DN7528_c0_g5_i1:62-946(-)
MKGCIYIELIKEFPASRLVIEFTGIESFQLTNGKKQIFEHFRHSVPISSFQESDMAPGQYEYPFTINLPAYIPSSFKIEAERLNAEVKYVLSGRLEPKESHRKKVPDLSYSNDIDVQTRPPLSLTPLSLSKREEAKKFFFFSQGFYQVELVVEKSAYALNESLYVMINIDNSECAMPLRFIEVQLVRVFEVLIPGRKPKRSIEILDSHRMDGVEAHNSRYAENNKRLFQLNLKTEGQLNRYTSTKGRFVSCSYKLVLLTNYDRIKKKYKRTLPNNLEFTVYEPEYSINLSLIHI